MLCKEKLSVHIPITRCPRLGLEPHKKEEASPIGSKVESLWQVGGYVYTAVSGQRLFG